MRACVILGQRRNY